MKDNEKYPWNKADENEIELPEPPPAPKERISAEMPVYAGPEFFGSRRRNQPPIQAVYAAPARVESKKRPDPEMNEVYAGPEFFERQRPAEQFMMVYAGPEYFNGGGGMKGIKLGTFCPSCMTAVKPEYNFCPNCGAPLPKEV